jgi:hypothetical protein
VTRAARHEFDRAQEAKVESAPEHVAMRPTAFADKVLGENNGHSAPMPTERVR